MMLTYSKPEFRDNRPLQEQVDNLSKFLLENFWDRIGEEGSEGAIEMAIRLLRQARVRHGRRGK
jgi:hypothetical protein